MIFATLVTAMLYISQSYQLNYVCRRVVRDIEISGQYDHTRTSNLLKTLGANGVEGLTIQVDARYLPDNKIQIDRITATSTPPLLRVEGKVTIPTLFSQYRFQDVCFPFTVQARNFEVH